MKSVVLCGSHAATHDEYTSVGTIDIEGIPVTAGLINAEEPEIDWHVPENMARVLIKVRAFSCNYRDKGLVLLFSKTYEKELRCTSIGSEFVGEVIATGPNVIRFQVGDRVIADNHYKKKRRKDLREGIPSNGASKRYRVLHEEQLMKVPSKMPDEVAAVFSLGAQTSYSIVRKLQIQNETYALITGATSNTALFIIQALRRYNVHIYATTTSDRHRQDLVNMGVRDVISLCPTYTSFREYPKIEEIMLQNEGFDYIIDPFNDLYLQKALEVIAMEGKYITCGHADQYSEVTGRPVIESETRPFRELIRHTMIRNAQVIGNCLGYTEDLRQAIEDYTTGMLDVTIDSVFRGNQVAAFFERTYNARDRFGKVVYCYDD